MRLATRETQKRQNKKPERYEIANICAALDRGRREVLGRKVEYESSLVAERRAADKLHSNKYTNFASLFAILCNTFIKLRYSL